MTSHPLETAARVAAVYVVLLVLLRVAGRREIGRLSPMDFLAMLMLAETVNPCLTAGDTSLGTALVAATTLILLTTISSFLSWRFRALERLLEGEPRLLVRDGRVDARVMRRERISEQELEIALRKENVDSLRKVRAARVEPDGHITVIRRED